ncbi:GntR family transcriptional regulator [Alkalicoccus halolimnae]|uniref:GntR family transcriptional regulator n=1 Tax=Alkalicoccus halolimnae TaxID=1667239 RepID=A0A5C7F486_9BACI|nr:GntR family transcriptional regulator [Alkalicoccus halolimnae]TXF85471.1 GntR family transcriptional regulator [Alkalicoccus halolimnae]
MLDSFERMTLSQKVAETIATQIVEGEMKPGTRLLEQELVEMFGTSRAPIREALYLLENQGIVERLPRRGVFVKKYTRKEVFDLYEVVYSLTHMALMKAVDTSLQEQLDELYQLIQKSEATIEEREIKNCFHLVERIHLLLFELPNNQVLQEVYQRLNKRWTTFRYLTLSHPISLERSIAEYKEIVMGIEAKNKEQITRVLKQKETRALSILEKLIDEDGS